MRVLFITRKHPPSVGGMQKLSYNIIKHWPLRPNDEIKVISLGKSQKHLFWFYPWALFRALFLAKRFDVVHLGDMFLCGIGWAVKKTHKKPVVIRVHGLDITFPNPLYQLYLKLFGFSLDKYICISRPTEIKAKKYGLQPTVVIPVGVAIREESDQNLTLKYKSIVLTTGKFETDQYQVINPIVIVTVGRLVKRKGVAWFVSKVLPYLVEKYPNIVYLVVGQGKECEKIKKIISQKNLGRYVYLLGQITDKELHRLYSLASMFVMPNIKVKGDMEGFGIVALEAGQYGLPVIARGIEGVKDAVKDGKNGTVIAGLKPKAWRHEISKLIDNPESARQQGQRNKIYVLEKFSYQKISEMYYQELLNTLKQKEP